MDAAPTMEPPIPTKAEALNFLLRVPHSTLSALWLTVRAGQERTIAGARTPESSERNESAMCSISWQRCMSTTLYCTIPRF